jgi:hypothetical protein
MALLNVTYIYVWIYNLIAIFMDCIIATRHMHVWMHIHYALALHQFVSGFFCLKASYHFTPLLNLRPLVFSPVLFGWFVSIHLRLFPERIIICDLCPIFQQHNLGLNKVLVCIYTFIYLFIYLFVLVYAYVRAPVHILYGERMDHIHIFYLIQRIIYSWVTHSSAHIFWIISHFNKH